MPTTFQGQRLTVLDITLLTSTVILKELLRYPEGLLAHGHPATETSAPHAVHLPRALLLPGVHDASQPSTPLE